MVKPLVIANRSSLLKPLSKDDILVPDEHVQYGERQHWASVIQPVYETFIFLLFIIWLVDLSQGGPLVTSGISFVLLGATLHTIGLAVTGGRAPVSRLASDPFSNPGGKKVNRTGLITVAGVLGLLGIVSNSLAVAGIAAVVIVVGRLVILLARWSFYERRYITNRRVIEAGGFLGSRISSMPLSRVTDISYHRTIMGELLGYSTMRVETAGQDQALGLVRFISDPSHFYEMLVKFSAPATPDGDA